MNWVREGEYFRAGPRSDRRACVEERRERESMLDSQE